MAYTLVIIQSDLADAKATAAGFLSVGCSIAAIDTDGRSAISLVKQHRPDALIMDLFLPSRNADEIAELLQESYSELLVKIAICSYKSDRMSSRFIECGGDFSLSTPVDYSFTVNRIKKAIAFHKRKEEIKQNPLRQCVWKYLIKINMSLTAIGFVYLQDAAELVIRKPSLLHDLTHGLYQSIADLHNSNEPSVERCIRTALDNAFAEGDAEYLYKVYGHIIDRDTGRPKPGQFIKQLTKMVCDDLLIEFQDTL